MVRHRAYCPESLPPVVISMGDIRVLTQLERDRQVSEHWDAQARAGTVTRDAILKQLEMRHIRQHVRDGMRVCDAGCGDGTTLIYLASLFPDCELVGFDESPEMVKVARRMAGVMGVSGQVTIYEGSVLDPPSEIRSSYPRQVGDWFDLVYTERVLINLPDWKTQAKALDALWGLKSPTGTLLCVESCQDGLDRLNDLRRRMDLPLIVPPWHNRYVRAHEMRDAMLVRPTVADFSSSYYFLSRIVNARLTKDEVGEGVEPSYDAPVNQLALDLPPIAEGYGQTWSWSWRMP